MVSCPCFRSSWAHAREAGATHQRNPLPRGCTGGIELIATTIRGLHGDSLELSDGDRFSIEIMIDTRSFERTSVGTGYGAGRS